MAHATSPVQAQVLHSLAMGFSIASAAKSAEIARGTIYNWLKDPAFASTLESAKQDYANTLRESLTELRGQALALIGKIMADESTPASVRLKAALALLNRPVDELVNSVISYPFPESADTTPDQELNTFEHISPEPAPAEDTFEDVEEFLNTFEHPAPKPQPVHSQKISRNALCPCGSGKKFKRCCLGARPVPAAA